MMKITKKMLLGCALWLGVFAQAQAEVINWSEPALAPLKQFLIQENIAQHFWPALTEVKMVNLPEPYDFLLTQPLMTMGIAKFYQRTPKVRSPLYVIDNPSQKTYSRAILMIVDNNKSRDDALAADKLGEATVAELGISHINFAALTPRAIDSVLHTQIPLGAILADNQISTHPSNVRYFKLNCTKVLDPYLNCSQHPVLYGRTNTLVRDDNGQWVVRVVEILTGNQLPGQSKGT
ncbi:MAG TPA: hypothetical protein VHE99_04165 [Gammaproteobacteria bacterium]|nr:hypothetical protein [Gammaproteobacteria bacterium]